MDVPRKVTGTLGELALQDEVYEPIVAKLTGAPKTVRELILLCHKFLRREPLAIVAAQHGQRDKVPTSAMINRRRVVAIEFGT